jgi:hypothetical protein
MDIILAARKQLKGNNYTELTIPNSDNWIIKIKRPTPVLMLKYGVAPNFLYGLVVKILNKGLVDEFAEKIDITEKVNKLICELCLDPQLELEDIKSYAKHQEDKYKLAYIILFNLALGKLEEYISEDFEEYTKTGLKHDAISFNLPVSNRLGLQGTIVGYDLDMAAGLYIQSHNNEIMQMQMELQANLMGYNLIR